MNEKYKYFLYGVLSAMLCLFFTLILGKESWIPLVTIPFTIYYFSKYFKKERKDKKDREKLLEKQDSHVYAHKMAKELSILESLFRNNIITQEEFDTKKTELQLKYGDQINEYLSV
ncbi:SHOCT domain-containing protein [Paenibacillus donghaensis]|uniref:SHOCT domain-containing protein n=1 Tax=Paenibacillus donghaensis TaxID=414771 RepID=A0A2Z2KL94_9BACL|nr:SHOCT domain-containing protein [Paenibacillus donghaensis]ASA21812.1 hypothetical protein B9T62_14140 [Paenibacillus donghaensis]